MGKVYAVLGALLLFAGGAFGGGATAKEPFIDRPATPDAQIDSSCPIPDVCIDERRLPLFIARATLRELIAGLEARAFGGATR